MTYEETKKKYDEVFNKYYAVFGKIYPTIPCSSTLEERIEEMEKCIKEGKPFQYSEKNVIY